MNVLVVQEEDNALGVDDWDYPKVDIIGEQVRITLGWFFLDLDPDESATYLEVNVDGEGKSRFILNDYSSNFCFDFVTKLKDYGYWSYVPLEDQKRGDKPYFIYADGHVPFSFKHWRFRAKVKIHYWALFHVPLLQRIRDYHYQRYCRKLFEVKKQP